MSEKYNFSLFTRENFKSYIDNLKVDKNFTTIQIHHTASPSYANCNGKNQIKLMESMKNAHLQRGFQTIAQHLSSFPDGLICTGRSFSLDGGGFYGNENKNSITIENVGWFDIGKDIMTEEQKETIIFMVAVLCKKFNIIPSTSTILYHTWMPSAKKTCPGSNFYGGNSKESANKNFIPLIKKELDILNNVEEVINMLYKDDSEISKWAKTAVYDLQEKGLMGGSNNEFNPKDVVNRETLAQVIYNVLKYLGK